MATLNPPFRTWRRERAGTISENNDVEIYGRRDPHNNVVAKTIRNRATGTTVSPEGVILAGMVWFITILLMTAVYGLGTGLVNGAAAVLTVQRVTVFAILLLCLFNLSLVLRSVKKIYGFFFFIIKKLFK